MDDAHAHHDDAPGQHDGGKEDAGPQTLEEDIGQGFGERVGNKEDGEGRIVLLGFINNAEVLVQAIDFRISNIGACSEDESNRPGKATLGLGIRLTIEEGDEVKKTKPWNELEIKMPQ